MARLGRYFIADQPLHVIQRGVDRQAVFFAADDYARYRDWLIEAAADYGCAVHAAAQPLPKGRPPSQESDKRHLNLL